MEAVHKGYKKERLQERIIQAVNQMLRSESLFQKNLGFVTVSKIRLSKDLGHATLYWDAYDPSVHESVKATLETMTGRVRKYLAKAIHTKKIPAIAFEYNSQFESEKAIEDILKEESDMGKTY